MEPTLRITEIFRSIQGESTRAGFPCAFVRLTGCSLRCVWCDTAYAFHGGGDMTGRRGRRARARARDRPRRGHRAASRSSRRRVYPLMERLLDAGQDGAPRDGRPRRARPRRSARRQDRGRQGAGQRHAAREPAREPRAARSRTTSSSSSSPTARDFDWSLALVRGARPRPSAHVVTFSPAWETLPRRGSRRVGPGLRDGRSAWASSSTRSSGETCRADERRGHRPALRRARLRDLPPASRAKRASRSTRSRSTTGSGTRRARARPRARGALRRARAPRRPPRLSRRAAPRR